MRRTEQYGKFLCELFDLSMRILPTGEAMDIRMFSNLAQMAGKSGSRNVECNGRP